MHQRNSDGAYTGCRLRTLAIQCAATNCFAVNASFVSSIIIIWLLDSNNRAVNSVILAVTPIELKVNSIVLTVSPIDLKYVQPSSKSVIVGFSMGRMLNSAEIMGVSVAVRT